ncbi:MAG: hypothetical protein ACKOWH_03735 [Rhodoluna sp.]
MAIATSPSHSDRKLRKVSMFGTKSGLRTIAAIISITLAASVGISLPANAADAYSASVTFLAKSFGANKQAITLYESQQDGITLEAMVQLAAAGKTIEKQLPAVKYMLLNPEQPLGTKNSGYLFNPDKTLKMGLAGKFLFASEALGVANNSVRYKLYKKLVAKIDASTGEISLTTSGAMDYAWVALGLHSYQEYTLANKVISGMIKLQNADGGFSAWDPTVSNIDGTGLVLQALNLAPTRASAAAIASRAAAEKKAVAYLKKSDSVDGSNWESEGAASVNSTAYAAMGLKAAGKNIDKYVAWLKTQLVSKGGFKSPYSNGAGDVFATSQALALLYGKTYLTIGY